MNEPREPLQGQSATWNRVEVAAPAGYSFGIILDSNGTLSLSVKPPDGDWPKGNEPMAGINTIAEGCTRYVVFNEECGQPGIFTGTNADTDSV